MAIFVRTEEGQEAAYSPQSALPRKLKSILKVIDGRTPISVFETNLGSFGDVKAILQSLDIAGLIKQIDPGAPFAQISADQSAEKPATQSAPSVAVAAPGWPPTRSPYSEYSNSVKMDAWQASDLATQAMPSSRHLQNPALQDILDSMANFVLTYLPEQSFQILKEIEEITSLELLAVTLGGYEQMVASVGEPSVLHVRSIKQMLRENM
jgi:hypothetical protein